MSTEKGLHYYSKHAVSTVYFGLMHVKVGRDFADNCVECCDNLWQGEQFE